MKKQEAITFVELLKKRYPDATCSLDFTTPFELVVAVMLQNNSEILLPLNFQN